MNVFSVLNFFYAIYIIIRLQLPFLQAEEAQPSIPLNKSYIIAVAILLHLCISLAHF